MKFYGELVSGDKYMQIKQQETTLKLNRVFSLVFDGGVETTLGSNCKFITNHGGVGVDLETDGVKRKAESIRNGALIVKVHSGNVTYNQRDGCHLIHDAVIELP